VLAQHKTVKVTGKAMEQKASKVLHSNKTKSLAGSTLSQSDKKR